MVDTGWVATIDVGAGDDIVHIKDDDAADSVKMGTGDDFLIINDSNDTLLDGEAGSDWLASEQSTGVLQARRRTQLTQATPKILKICLARQQRHTNR